MDLHITKPEQTLSEEIFNKIYPNSVYKLSDLLSNTLSIEEIKKIVTDGVASKSIKKEGFQNILSSRKKLFNTYTLPVLKPSSRVHTEIKSASNYATPKKTKFSSPEQLCGYSSVRKLNFVKSPTVKITYQVGPSITDTHSIRIEGKLLERINFKNNAQMKKNRNGIIQTECRNGDIEKEKKKIVSSMPKINIHEVDFVSIFN